MTRCWLSVLLGLFTFAALAGTGVQSQSIQSQSIQSQSILTHHLREAVSSGRAQPLSRLGPDQVLHLDIVLPLRDQAGLDAFLNAVYDPASPLYRHFLTPREFTERFGPTQADYDALVGFAQAHGLTVTGGSRDAMEVQAAGRVAAVEAAFHVTMRLYQHPTEDRTFYAPDGEPSWDLPFPLWHISGLDNFSIPRPMLVSREEYAKARGIAAEAVVPHATTGSGPSASYLGSDMRAAYYGGSELTGAGQNVGLVEFNGANLADLETYYKNTGQTLAVTPVLLSTDGSSTTCVYADGCNDIEQTLDMTQALGMAPGLASLVLYFGRSDVAVISAMTTHDPLPTSIGCSWGWTPVDPNTLNPYFERMAAQGQNFFTASGDKSTWSASNHSWPADNAYVVTVGGTDLVTASAGGPWKSETAWVDSGGGISPNGIAIPAWQQLSGVVTAANGGSTTLRNGPDVSANANFTYYVCANQGSCTANGYGGTSFAAPLWAGYMALVNEQLQKNGQSSLGFLNPIVYPLNLTSSYATGFHDIASGTSGSFSATAGYDLVTGWGSPRGTDLIDLLVGSAAPATGFSLSASQSALTVVAGQKASVNLATAVSGGFDSAIALSASGQPKGVTVAFSAASIGAPGSGSATATITVASTAAAGTYPIALAATGGGITHSATVTLTVTAPAAPAFTLAVNSASLTVAAGASNKVQVSAIVSGGFNAGLALSASGLPTGVTAAFSPASLAAPGSGSSTLTLSVSATAAAGTYPILLKATGGGITQRATVSLTVSAKSAGSLSLTLSQGLLFLSGGQSGSTGITVATSGGFDAAVSLTVAGLPPGVKGTFTSSSLAAPGAGSSRLNLAVGKAASAGIDTITVTATGGGVTKSATLTVLVFPSLFASQ